MTTRGAVQRCHEKADEQLLRLQHEGAQAGMMLLENAKEIFSLIVFADNSTYSMPVLALTFMSQR